VARVQIASGTPLYFSDRSKKPLPSPMWNTQVSVVDTEIHKVPLEKLEPRLVKWLRKVSKNWSFDELKNEMKKYPRENLSTVEEEIQIVPVPIILQSPPAAKSEHFPENVDLDPQTKIVDPQAKVEKWLKEIENEVPVGSAHFSDQEVVNFLAELTKDIENSFEAIHQIENEVQVLILKNNEVPQKIENAKATGKFPCSQKDLQEIENLVHENILEIESQKKAQEKAFAPIPDFVHYCASIRTFFGPLPPPSAG